MIALDEMVAHLERQRFTFANEAELRAGIAASFRADWRGGTPLDLLPEVHLSERDRIDFMAAYRGAAIGIEVKVKGSLSDICAQLLRYAESPRVGALILVTARAAHKHLHAETLLGKPLRIVHAGGIG